ncbi:type VI secretion lipoprotein TssJ [Maridesulfovibrio hydrothermalis]|uniref:Type VI secretion lipoprotein, VC_A0113 family n=1 Tax=Maridesulfovibrio hydrothermalis AM13 = DSM 14728 TaxID=1121451 RepID=L0RF30_9BACT|nr:type VI secretion lipoprotein TssJ [Maridesulfovibrio hydrothermalis]CCO24166.1 Type VI secretion lipoprotein, VC_A0113 family [Maridesulfovibrio hydrothermalis AM13 = DSM 14728]
MRCKCFKLFFVMLLFITVSCGGKQKPVDPTTVTTPASSPDQMKWTYQTNAISFQLNVDKNLNEYDGSPHSLLLCVYQLTELSKFKELAGSTTGLGKLYNCTSFGPTVKQVKREFVQPGKNATISMDRAEGAKFVGIAAGYYDLQGGGATRTWQIPMNISETGMLFWSDTWYAPAKLDAMIILGPHEIQKVGE